MSSSRTEADTDTDTGTGSGSGTDIQARNASAETAAEARAAETETGPMPLPELPEDADWTDESLARLGNRPEDGGERTPPGDPDTSAESLATGWDGPTAAEDPDARAREAEFEAYEPPRGEKEGESDQGPRRRGFLSKLLG